MPWTQFYPEVQFYVKSIHFPLHLPKQETVFKPGKPVCMFAYEYCIFHLPKFTYVYFDGLFQNKHATCIFLLISSERKEGQYSLEKIKPCGKKNKHQNVEDRVANSD